MNHSILTVHNLSKSFGKFLVIDGLNLDFKQGMVTFVMGPNGAGKTTLINLVTALLKPDSGKIFFKDQNITGLSSHELVKRKITRSFQVMNIFPQLTVFQNIELPVLVLLRKTKKWYAPADSYSDMTEMVHDLLQKTGLLEKKSVVAGELSHGDQRLLELAIAIAPRPELCFLDEPTSGTSPTEGARLMQLMKKLNEEENITFIVVEHDMETVFKCAEWIMVMHKGRILAEGNPEQIRENKDVLEIYLGEEVV